MGRTSNVIIFFTIIAQISFGTESKIFKRSLICVGENLGPNASPECKALNERMNAPRERPTSFQNIPSGESEFSKALDLMKEVGRQQELERLRQAEEERDREYANQNKFEHEFGKDETYSHRINILPYVILVVILVVGITITVVCYVRSRQNNSRPSYSIPVDPPRNYVPPYDTQVQSGFIPNYSPTAYVPTQQVPSAPPHGEQQPFLSNRIPGPK